MERMLYVPTVAGACRKNLPAQRCHRKWLEPSPPRVALPHVAGRAGGGKGHRAVMNTAENQGRERADGTW